MILSGKREGKPEVKAKQQASLVAREREDDVTKQERDDDDDDDCKEMVRRSTLADQQPSSPKQPNRLVCVCVPLKRASNNSRTQCRKLGCAHKPPRFPKEKRKKRKAPLGARR